MGEKPIWGIPKITIGDNLEFDKVNIANGMDFQAPTDIKGSVDVSWCKLSNLSLTFDIQLTQRDVLRLKKMINKHNRLPRKLKKAVKKYVGKHYGLTTKKIRFSFKTKKAL